MAAGEAVAALAEGTPHAEASHEGADRASDAAHAGDALPASAPADGLLSFDAFDVARVLAHGAPLLASGGQARSLPNSLALRCCAAPHASVRTACLTHPDLYNLRSSMRRWQRPARRGRSVWPWRAPRCASGSA